MLRQTRLVFVGVAASTALLWATPPVSHALLVTTATGPNISGSLGGMAEGHAAWSLTATADEALAETNVFNVPALPGPFDLWSLPVFRIDPVPAPLPVLAVAGAFSWSRQLRRRLARRAG